MFKLLFAILLEQFCSQHKHELQRGKLLWAYGKQIPAMHRGRKDGKRGYCGISSEGRLLGMSFCNSFSLLHVTENVFSREAILFLVSI